MIATDKGYNFRPFSPNSKNKEKQEHQLTQVSTTKVGMDVADLFTSETTNHSVSPPKSKSKSSGTDKSKSKKVKEDGNERDSNSNKVSSPNTPLNEFPAFPDPFAHSWHESSKDSNPKSPTRTVSRIVKPSNQTNLIVTSEKEPQNPSDKASSASPKDDKRQSKHSSPRKEKREEGTNHSPTKDKDSQTPKDDRRRQKSASKIEDKENRRIEERRRSKSCSDDDEWKNRKGDDETKDSQHGTHKEKRKHGDSERSKSMYHKSRNEMLDNQEVAAFLNIIESLAISADKSDSPVVREKIREKEHDKTRRESRRLSGDNHKKKESKDHKESSSKKESHKSSRRGSGETKDDDHKLSKSSRKEGNEDQHKRPKEKSSEKSNSRSDHNDEKGSKGHKASSSKIDSPEKDKKRKEDQSKDSQLRKALEDSSHGKSSSKKDGYGLQYFLKDGEKSETPKQSDEQSIRSRRSSIAAWREQSKSRSEKDKDDGSRRQLLPLRGSRKSNDEKKEGKDKDKDKGKDKESDSDEEDDDDIDDEAKKEEERKRILLESRIGPVRALSRRRNDCDDTETLLSSLPLESELDQMMKLSTGGGYLPAGLGATTGNNSALNQNAAQRDPSRSRRQSILCAADFSERSESNDDDLLTPAAPQRLTGKKSNLSNSVVFDSSLSSLNSSFRGLKNDKFNAAGLSTSLAIASSPTKSAQRAKTAPSSQDGDDAIQNILKSRRLRGDNNVAPRAIRAEAEDTKKKAKKFSFV